MRKQSSLDQYFRSKSSPSLFTSKSSLSPATSTTITTDMKTKKRKSLSLIRSETPKKTPKMESSCMATEPELVNLCSDDETTPPQIYQTNNTSKQSNNTHNKKQQLNKQVSREFDKSDVSNSSETTIPYNLTPTTPQKSPQTSSKSSFSSPKSQKFFSPTKKRAIFQRTPVKKNLCKEYYRHSSQSELSSVENEDFIKACQNMDDKSIFLLTIINKFLKEENLKKLLDDKSVELLSSCLHILKPGIRLVCRLFWRQHGWYRKKTLVQITNDKMDDIGESPFMEMLNCLIENGLVTADCRAMNMDDLMKILKREELIQICKDLKLNVKSKQSAEDTLRLYSQQSSIGKFFKQTTSNNSERVLKIMNTKAGNCYKLSDLARSALDKLHLLMYLGINYEIIRDKKLELLLIHDKIKRETYPIDKDMDLDNASVIFKSKEEFTKYWNAHIIYEDYLTQTETSKKCTITLKVYELYKEIDEEDMIRYKSLPTWLRRYTPAYIYVKLLESGVQELKKDALHRLLAVEILSTLISQIAFRQHKKAEWYAEKALVLHKLLARHDEAALVLLEGLKCGLPEDAKDVMRPRALKIAKQRNIKLCPGLSEALIECASKGLILENTFEADHVTKHHMEQSPNKRGKKKFAVSAEDGTKFMDAEDYCVLHYTSTGEFTHGEHREGRIVIALFFLLFWDIIYTKPRGVVGVFLSHYQRHPLDMNDGSFYANRQTLIVDRLLTIEKMDTATFVDVIKRKWDERPEHEISPAKRDLPWESVRGAAACLGPLAVSALCRRLALHYGRAHSGFPDLTLWNEHTKKIKFVEVKTDTDKPSMKQLQWMRYLRDHGIETGFCYVGAATTRSRARAPAPTLTVRTATQINELSNLT